MTKKNLTGILFYIILLLFSTSAFTQEISVNFDSDNWQLYGGQKTEFLGRKCLMGTAILKDVTFENGIIEVDIAFTPESRSYAGFIFRMQDTRNFENFYIRPHREPFYPDALQYTPVINGISSWQLYSGTGMTNECDIPENEWVRLKMVVAGAQAKVYLVDMEKPALEIKYLQHGRSSGNIGLYGQANGTAYFSNFKYKIDNSIKFEPAAEIETDPGTITEWNISQNYRLTEVNLESYPENSRLQEIKWEKIKCLPGGLVDISRYRGRTGAEADFVYIKTNIFSDRDKNKLYYFGYSDIITIFLNGEMMFTGNSAYQSRDRSFVGIVGYNDGVNLPLKKGNNELLLLLGESFGGWGFKFREANAVFEDKSLTKKWELKKDLRMPESALYDKERNIIYVTSFDRDGRRGQQFISRVTTDGKIETLKWVDGLVRPTGITIFKDKLYAVERTGVAVIDINTGKIIERLPIPGAVFPNDVEIDKDGIIYVSDNVKSIIYRYINEKFEEWLTGGEVIRPNGLGMFNNKLYFGTTGFPALYSADLKNGKITKIAQFDFGAIDGIKMDKNGNFLVAIYRGGRLYRVSPSGQITKLLHSPDTYCADFDYIAEHNLIVIPSLTGYKIHTYEYK